MFCRALTERVAERRDKRMSVVFRDISDEPHELERLSRFYDKLYVAGFPDPNERESLDNMKQYLKLRREGWYRPNNYHIILALDGDQTVGASVSDYLAKPNCGIIEFLLVAQALWGKGIGRKLHDATIAAFDADARRIGREGVDAIVIELNDPYRVSSRDDNYDPFERAMIWNQWGYGRLCFPYVQPALSAKQEPVTCLLLGMKPIAPHLREQAPPGTVCDVLAEYMRLAMRIKKPEFDPTYIAMERYLSNLSAVRIEPLSVYIGRDPARPLITKPVMGPTDPDFKVAIELYARAFPPGPTVIDARMFEQAFKWSEGADWHYHLWALSEAPGRPIAGMISFFVLPRFGFGGYMALEPPLKGTGRARVAIKRVEEQIIRDEPAAQRQYIECVSNSREEAVFRELGFHPVPVRYHQPPIFDKERFGPGRGPQITTLTKRLGWDYGDVAISSQDFLRDLKTWLTHVYRIADPEASETFKIARSTFGIP
jgi:GNAT superfamily N-acetyltransferase